ncbi:ABC transporter permease [Paenibacillus sambharensis]|uniref:ABC transporter permease n=1 Tax=Paenibacillus sambharensis TaxID=1803190 RepID=A0A2W1L1P1_9BACL|nr:ABC transporter permease [Paenibacillus sambharensis]PZD92973.1 ABC transporter permease [Paenibacillus sambharensis]
MNVIWQLTLRNLKLNRSRTVVTLIGIILSAAMICGVATLIASFQDVMVEGAKQTDGSHHATFINVPLENSKYIEEHAYTETAMFSKRLGYAGLDQPANASKPYMLVRSYDKTAFEHFPVKLKEGRLPEKDGELVISEELLYGRGEKLKIGDTLTLDIGRRVVDGTPVGEEPLSDNEELEILMTKTYTITGIIHRPNFESNVEPGVTVISYLDRSTLEPADSVNVSIVSDNPRKIYDKAPGMGEEAGAERVSYNKELLKFLGVSDRDNVNQMFQIIGLIIILLVVVGSVAVIYNAFAISVSERKKQFGMLSSVGATARQIRRVVFLEGTVLGLIAIPVGILSGIGGIGVTLHFVNRLLTDSLYGGNVDVSLRLIVSPYTVLVTVLFVALTIFLSAYVPARRASKISPVEAIRLTTDIKIKGKKLRTSRLTRALFGIEGELALKNLKRNSKRYRATVFSLFISIVLFVSFSTFMTYGFASSNMYYGKMTYDMSIDLLEVLPQDELAFYEEVTELNGVSEHSLLRRHYGVDQDMDINRFGSYIAGKLKDGDEDYLSMFSSGPDRYRLSYHIYALNNEQFDAYASSIGAETEGFHNPDEPKGILINANTIDGPKLVEYAPTNIKAGEKISLHSSINIDDKPPKKMDIVIGAVTENYPFGVATTYPDSVNLILSEEVYEELMETRSYPISDAANYELYLKLSDDTDYIQFEEQVRGLSADYTAQEKVFINNRVGVQEQVERTKTVVSIFLYGFVSLITLIGVTNIFNTISTNIALRRREFAMLKSVGLTPQGFNKIMNYESIFYGLKALAYGLPVSMLISLWMYYSFSGVFTFEFSLPWREIGYCVAGVFIIVFLTMMYASRKLKKENIIDALKVES